MIYKIFSKKTRESIRYALQSFKEAYNFFGIVVAIVASANFVFSLFHVTPSLVLETLLLCYRAIVHGAIHWILYPFAFDVPPAVADLIFLYVLIGGSVGRSYRENPEEFPDRPSFKEAFKELVKPQRSQDWHSRVNGFFFHVPRILRSIRRALWWPRYIRDWFARPMVYVDDYYGYNRWHYLRSGTKSGKQFLFDRRMVFFIQMATILLGFILVLILNAFLTVPK